MDKREELFQNAPIGTSVFQMAIPSVISSLVLVIYNMADTFFYWSDPRSAAGCGRFADQCSVRHVYGDCTAVWNRLQRHDFNRIGKRRT